MDSKILAIFFDDAAVMAAPLNTLEYFESYSTLAKKMSSHGFETRIVRGGKTYLGNMQFSQGWILSQGKLKPCKKFTASIIYRKGTTLKTNPQDVVLNHQELFDITQNKFATYQAFSEWMSPSYLIDTHNWQEVLLKIRTSKVVLKPIQGCGGFGIQILEKNGFNFSKIDQSFAPYLVQEFLDSSAGIPNIVNGLHDLRLDVFNGVVKMAEIREPKKGSYLANISQGGTLFHVPIEKIPHWAFDCVNAVEKRFQKYHPRMYTVDMLYANGKPYIVELNSQRGLPWLVWEKFGNYYTKLHQYIIETLLSAFE